MSLFLISTLWTLLRQLEPASTADSATRDHTPPNVAGKHDADRVPRQNPHMPGVEEVSAYQWFGGVYKDPANFFAQFAVDPEHFFAVYPDMHVVSPDQMEAFKKGVLRACRVSLAKRYGGTLAIGALKGPFPDVELGRGFLKDSGSESFIYVGII
jgi:hypothetical protein